MNSKVVSTLVLLTLSHAAAAPVTVKNCGNTLTFTSPPERVISTYSVTTEILLRLGLGSKIVGAADYGEPLPKDLQTAYSKLPRYGKNYVLPREQTLARRPQLVFDNEPAYVYNGAKGNATREEINAAGAQIYSLTAKCPGENQRFESLYSDLRNLGQIFGVQSRAEALIRPIQARAAAVTRAVANTRPTRVMMYSDGQGPINVYGPGGYADVLRLARGVNVFADLKAGYGPVSVEEVAKRDIEVILVIGLGDDAEASAAFLRKTFAKSTAVKNNRVVVIPYDLINPGLRNIDGLEQVARALHPEAFKR